MQAHELIIDAKVKTSPFDIVAATDFQTHVGQPIDPHTVLDKPNATLYCLDHANRQALFVETPPNIDLLSEPFYFIAQYDHAQKLIALPYETLHAVAQQVAIDPHRIILFYSTGRCGSTLVSNVMNLNPAVVSFSEPDVFSQLVMLRTSGASTDAEIATLLHDSTRMMAANAQAQGYQFFAFKFRSYVLSVSDLLYQTIPQAKLLFMYRHALPWAYSFSRAFGSSDDDLEARLEKSAFRYMIPSVNQHLLTHGNVMRWIEYVACMWVSTMQNGRYLQQQGAPLAHARFEALQAAPQPVLQSLLAHCGLPMPDSDQLAQVLAKDSQAGTAGAQARQKPARHLTKADLAKLDRVIRQMDATLSPDTILL